jgi:1,4-alpha-glucan branching enzyme
MTAARRTSTEEPSTTSHLSEHDLYLFNEGTHRRMGEKLGAHPLPGGGVSFGVWAPNADRVAVIGDFNHWNPDADQLRARGSSGIWEGVVGHAVPGHVYKFAITTRAGDVLEKADPFARCTEHPPRTGSVVWDLSYGWGDADWMRSRGDRIRLDAPLSVYEVHLGSWRRDPSDPRRFLGYAEIAEPLIRHVAQSGFTHVEFLPLMEHPFYGSWGYQTTGFFAPTRRYGTPQELMFLIDQLHQAGIGGLVVWVT